MEKVDGNTKEKLSGVHFAHHKQITIGDVTDFDLNPMPGYTDLVSDSNGIIPLLDGTLPAGTYEIRETRPVPGYQALPRVHFTVGSTGRILIQAQYSDWLKETVDPLSGNTEYTITLPNYPNAKKVSFLKVDNAAPDTVLPGAVFDLYRVVDGQRQNPALYTGLTSGADGLLAKDGVSVFELEKGTYHLVETSSPAGYDMREDPVVITVSDTDVIYDEGTSISAGGPAYDEDTQVYTMKVSNTAGVALPSTGGPGTTLFYVIGMMFMLAAGTGLVARRRAGLMAKRRGSR